MFDVFNPYFPDSFKFQQEHLASKQNNNGTLSKKKNKKEKRKKPNLTLITIPSFFCNNLHQIMTIGNVLTTQNFKHL